MDPAPPDLPPHWQPDPDLKHLLPASEDWRTFGRVRENPNRYLMCVCTGRLWDIYRSCFSTPTIVGKSRRRRFYIAMGPNAEPLRIFASRIVASLVFSASHEFNRQAHHPRLVLEGDGWRNLRWQTQAQNLAVEAERREALRRTGEDNGRVKLTDAQLIQFVAHHADYERKRIPFPWDHFADWLGVTTRQLRRIADGGSRRARVAAIRAALAEGRSPEA